MPDMPTVRPRRPFRTRPGTLASPAVDGSARPLATQERTTGVRSHPLSRERRRTVSTHDQQEGARPRWSRPRRRAGLIALAVATTAGLLIPALVSHAATAPLAITPAAVPAPPAGFSLTWADDFTGTAGTGLGSG